MRFRSIMALTSSILAFGMSSYAAESTVLIDALVGGKQVYTQILEGHLRQNIPPNMPANVSQQRIQAALQQYSYENTLPQIRKVTTKYFNANEMAQIEKFLSSPVGKRFTGSQILLNKDLQTLFSDVRNKATAVLQAPVK